MGRNEGQAIRLECSESWLYMQCSATYDCSYLRGSFASSERLTRQRERAHRSRQ
jgi:hypothetical protein